MTTNMMMKCSYWCAAVFLMALPSSATVRHNCTAGNAVTTSRSGQNRQADRLFQNIESDARNASRHAAKLERFVDVPTLNFESHDYELTQVRTAVNDMGSQLCRLESMRAKLVPWQQKTVDRFAENIQLMADNTADAIRFVNAHQEELWLPVYQKYLTNLYNESHTLTRSAEEALQYASTRKQVRNLSRDLGVAPRS